MPDPRPAPEPDDPIEIEPYTDDPEPSLPVESPDTYDPFPIEIEPSPDEDAVRAREAIAWAVAHPDAVLDPPPRPEPIEVTEPRPADMIAGTAAAASGALVGWASRGEMTRWTLRRVAEEGGVTPLKAKGPKAHARAALDALSGHKVIGVKGPPPRGPDGTPAYDARWVVAKLGADADTSLYSSAGEVVLTATLRGETMTLEGLSTLQTRVEEDYARRLGEEIYSPSDINAWIRGALEEELCAVRFPGGLHYIARRYRAPAERFLEAVRAAGWGTEWLLPALPVATSEQLREGLAAGLWADVDKEMRDLETRRADALLATGRDLGERGVISAVQRLRALAERVRAYSLLLGAERFGALATSITETAEGLEASVSHLGMRFANIFEELARENRGMVLEE